MLRLPGQHLSFLVGFPFCILICTYSVLGSWQYFSVAAETAAAHTHTRKIAKKKNEKKLGKPTNRFRHLRWNIYVAVNGNVNKSWLRKIIDKTREIWSRKTCSKEILLHNCVNSMGEEWIRMFFFIYFSDANAYFWQVNCQRKLWTEAHMDSNVEIKREHWIEQFAIILMVLVFCFFFTPSVRVSRIFFF